MGRHARLPKEFEARFEGISRNVPPPPGSVLVVPTGSPTWWRWSSHSDSLHVFLEPGLVARVATETFELDPARVSVPPLDGLHLPQLRAANTHPDLGSARRTYKCGDCSLARMRKGAVAYNGGGDPQYGQKIEQALLLIGCGS